MDMLYYIYIGSNRVTIDHLSKITGGMFMAVSSCNKAAKVIDGIRERYNTSILYEESTPQKGQPEHHFPAQALPRVYIILITEGLQKEHRKLYLQAGVNNTLSPWPAREPPANDKIPPTAQGSISCRNSASHTVRYSTPSTCLCGSVSSTSFCRCRTDCAVSHIHRDSHSHPRGKQREE